MAGPRPQRRVQGNRPAQGMARRRSAARLEDHRPRRRRQRSGHRRRLPLRHEQPRRRRNRLGAVRDGRQRPCGRPASDRPSASGCRRARKARRATPTVDGERLYVLGHGWRTGVPAGRKTAKSSGSRTWSPRFRRARPRLELPGIAAGRWRQGHLHAGQRRRDAGGARQVDRQDDLEIQAAGGAAASRTASGAVPVARAAGPVGAAAAAVASAAVPGAAYCVRHRHRLRRPARSTSSSPRRR